MNPAIFHIQCARQVCAAMSRSDSEAEIKALVCDSLDKYAMACKERGSKYGVCNNWRVLSGCRKCFDNIGIFLMEHMK